MFYLGYNFRRGLSTLIVDGEKSMIDAKRSGYKMSDLSTRVFLSGGE